MVQSSQNVVLQPIQVLGSFGSFAADIVRSLVAGRWSLKEAFAHASTLSTRCFIPVNVTIFPFGAVMGLQGMQIFDMFSAHRLVSTLLAQFVVQELGPVLAAVLVAAQGGSSFAAELGTMRIKEELSATEVMGVDSVGWHVAPRVLAMALVVPLLVGLGVDDGIHVVHRMREDEHLPADVATCSVGRAIAMTTLTTCASFAVMLFSTHPGMESMALVLIFGLPLCLLASVTLIPAGAVLLGLRSGSS